MYLPALRDKMGELKALEELEKYKLTKNKIKNLLPIILINEITDEALKKISKKYSRKVLIDTRLVSDTKDIKKLVSITKQNKNFNIIYCFKDIKYAGNKDYVKILDTDAVGILKDIKNNNFNINLFPKNIIIDFGYINNSSPYSYKYVNELIKYIKNRNITILSGSVPNPIPKNSDENYTQDIYEYKLFEKISYDNKNINFNYGDYGTVHPNLTDDDIVKMTPIVQIKYTKNKNEYWFIRNGLRKGEYKFKPVANEIINDSKFKKISWADEFLFDVINTKNHNIGNAMTWAEVGINRHLSIFI
ncbi:beta family protein [Fructilactobacillus cliffordii]|uniref:beta family protein n=1 Tax=Fructilactobacillus cliffordii TaxID=2940299 RepID=UPI002093ED67|nr:beta family protein [Fructilactobacillus cliffordii]USS85911.1 beta family protein [Fructilactobacillus cliffordii]